MKFCQLALIAAAIGNAQQTVPNPPTQQTSPNFFSVPKEIEMGNHLANEVAAHTTPVNNAAADAYVNRVVSELAQQIPDSKIPYLITLVKEPMGAEPTVIMGGHIFLSLEHFRAAKNEDEFVAIMADAMARVADRDEARKMSSHQIQEIALLPLKSNPNVHPDQVRPAMESSSQRAMLRRQEQADALAVHALAAAGYSPMGLISYVEQNEANEPFHDERSSALRQVAAQAPVPTGRDGAEFARVRTALGIP
jgi:predicted Zn-dependent protease